MGHRRAAATGPLGGLRSAWGMSRQVTGTLGFFNVALDHMQCDVVRGGQRGRAYLFCLMGGGLGGPVGGRRPCQAVGDGRAFWGHLLWGRGLRGCRSAAGRRRGGVSMSSASTPASASGGGVAPSAVGSGLKVNHFELGKLGVLSVCVAVLRVLSGVKLSICTRGLGIFSCRRRSASGV